jgi:HlyD family secretion protein
MKKLNLSLYLFIVTFFFTSCGNTEDVADASGVFEATEVIVSSEASGKILWLDLNESDILKKGQNIGQIDSVQLHLKKLQLEAAKRAILSGKPDIPAQIAATETEIEKQKKEKVRIEKLLAGDVATQKQMDDINSLLQILDAKLKAQKSGLNINVNAIYAQSSTIDVQIRQIEDQLQRCKIKSPLNGTVLVKYAEQGEMTGVGKPIFKIADLSNIVLRAYVTGNQLSQIKLNQKVTIRTDNGEGGLKNGEGTITWISDKAEFTPKTIQTKDERANKVYAMKVSVKNDGIYKIGMYGEVKF